MALKLLIVMIYKKKHKKINLLTPLEQLDSHVFKIINLPLFNNIVNKLITLIRLETVKSHF